MEGTEGTGLEGSQRLMGTGLREATKAPHNRPRANQTVKPGMANANDEGEGMPSEAASDAKVMN